MSQRKPRVLLAKLGDGHKDSFLNLAKRLSDAGFEIVYTELEDPVAIVGTAIQECVDHIGITLLEDRPIEIIEGIVKLLNEKGEVDITLAVGGLIEEEQCKKLKQMGVDACFPKGTSYEELITWAKEYIGKDSSMIQK